MTQHAAVAPQHFRVPGHSSSVTAAEMAARIARFRDIQPDRAAFPDLKDPQRERSVTYMVSSNGLAGPAGITVHHNFHLAHLIMKKGVKPSTHSHPYAEVFMPLNARFRFYYGETLDLTADLDPYDVISIPPGVFRTFENLEDKEGHVISIWDVAGCDPHVGIVVPKEIYERYYSKNWVPGVEPK